MQDRLNQNFKSICLHSFFSTQMTFSREPLIFYLEEVLNLFSTISKIPSRAYLVTVIPYFFLSRPSIHRSEKRYLSTNTLLVIICSAGFMTYLAYFETQGKHIFNIILTTQIVMLSFLLVISR